MFWDDLRNGKFKLDNDKHLSSYLETTQVSNYQKDPNHKNPSNLTNNRPSQIATSDLHMTVI